MISTGLDPSKKRVARCPRAQRESFSARFGRDLRELARKDPRICAVTAAMTAGTGLTDFAKEFPQRFFDVGIAEEHAVTMTAGMAKQGLIPVFAVYSTFFQRGYDMLIHDIAIDHLMRFFVWTVPAWWGTMVRPTTACLIRDSSKPFQG